MFGGASLSLLKSMIQFSHYKMGAVESVDVSLNLGKVLLSTTITRLDTYVDCSASCVTREFSGQDLLTSSSKPLRTSLTLRLPERLAERL